LRKENRKGIGAAWSGAAVSGWLGLVIGLADLVSISATLLVANALKGSPLGIQLPAGEWLLSQTRNMALDVLAFILMGLFAGLLLALAISLSSQVRAFKDPERIFHSLFVFLFLLAGGLVPVIYTSVAVRFDPDRGPLSVLAVLALAVLSSAGLSALSYRGLGRGHGPLWMRASAHAGAGALFILGLRLVAVLVSEGRLLLGAAAIAGWGLLAWSILKLGAIAADALKEVRGLRPVLAGLSVLAAFFCGFYFAGFHRGAPQRAERSGLPNVLMIVLDTVRADHLSVYGYERPTTPILEEIAGQGALFTKAYSAAPWTLPSHASFFTGLYPAAHGCTHEKLRLEKDHLTLAELLRGQGYVTLGYSNNPLVGRMSELNQGFERFVEGWRPEPSLFMGAAALQVLSWRVWPDLFPADAGAAGTFAVVERWLKEVSQSGTPFFLFINYMEAHPPMPRHAGAYVFFESEAEAHSRLARVKSDFLARNAGRADIGQDMKDALVRLYDGQIYYLDNEVGRIADALDRLNLSYNTILIILSDHGELFGEHGVWGHERTLYNELLHVPLIIRCPALVKGGVRVSEPVSLRELPAMIGALQKGGSIGDAVDAARARRTEIEGLVAEVARPVAFMEVLKKRFPGYDVRPLDRRQKAFIRLPWKLLWDSRGGDELFNLEIDPQETISFREAEFETYRKMLSELDQYRERYPAGLDKPAPLPAMDRETLEKLRSLGYVP